MFKFRYATIMFCMLLHSAISFADTRVHMDIGINVPVYPELVLMPGYPVYYAPQLGEDYFFYDGLYWVYQDDNWYSSFWYDGPWMLEDPEDVPVFVLRVPVRYYLRPPAYFIGWRLDTPPHWGEHWGHGWEQHRRGWDRWDHNVIPAPAPRPVYQREYGRNHYPRQIERQQEIHRQNYHFQPHERIAKLHYQQPGQSETPVPGKSVPEKPERQRTHEAREPKQPHVQVVAPPVSPQNPGADPRELTPAAPHEGGRAMPQSEIGQGEQPAPQAEGEGRERPDKKVVRKPKRERESIRGREHND